jgi:hypothetical protein
VRGLALHAGWSAIARTVCVRVWPGVRTWLLDVDGDGGRRLRASRCVAEMPRPHAVQRRGTLHAPEQPASRAPDRPKRPVAFQNNHSNSCWVRREGDTCRGGCRGKRAVVPHSASGVGGWMVRIIPTPRLRIRGVARGQRPSMRPRGIGATRPPPRATRAVTHLARRTAER